MPLILPAQLTEINVTTLISHRVSLSWILKEVSFEEQRGFAIVLLFSTFDRLVIKWLEEYSALPYEYRLKWCAILLKIFNKLNQVIPEITKLFFENHTSRIRYLNDFIIIIPDNFLVFYIYKHFYLCHVISNERNQSKIMFSLARFR